MYATCALGGEKRGESFFLQGLFLIVFRIPTECITDIRTYLDHYPFLI